LDLRDFESDDFKQAKELMLRIKAMTIATSSPASPPAKKRGGRQKLSDVKQKKLALSSSGFMTMNTVALAAPASPTPESPTDTLS